MNFYELFQELERFINHICTIFWENKEINIARYWRKIFFF